MTLRIASLGLFAMVTPLAAGDARSTGPATAPDSPTLQPTRAFVIQQRTSGERFTLAPGGESIYSVEPVRHVNVWALLVYRWPETLALAIVVMGPPAALIVWRRRRRRRGWEPGEPYCQRCGYRLTSLSAGASCPECGSELGAAPRGRVIAPPPWSRRRRIATLAAVGLGVGMVARFATQFAGRRAAETPDPVAGRFHWNSRLVQTLGEKLHAGWILRHGEQVLVIVERRLDDRTPVGEFDGTSPDMSAPDPQVSPDGKTLWASNQDGLHAWDIVTRRQTSQTLAWPDQSDDWRDARVWIGTEAVVAQTSKVSTTPARLAAWNLASGQREAIDPNLDLDTTMIAPLPDGVRVLAELQDKSDQPSGYLRLVDRRTGAPAGPGLVRNNLDVDSPLLGVTPQISSDGKRLFPHSSYRKRYPSQDIYIHGFNLETGNPLPLVGPFRRPGLQSVECRVMANGRLLLCWPEPSYGTTGWSDLEIWDVDENRPVATLTVAPATLDEWVEAKFSADERTVMVTSKLYSRNARGTRVWTFDLSAVAGIGPRSATRQ